jgi:hypothetical protein
MKPTVLQPPEKPIPDSTVNIAIEYLDSSTDQRECRSIEWQIQLGVLRTQGKRTQPMAPRYTVTAGFSRRFAIYDLCGDLCLAECDYYGTAARIAQALNALEAPCVQ